VIVARRDFSGREELARALADDVARALAARVDAKGSAVLAVSGGTTPIVFFEKLANTAIVWKSVTVTLVDERQVPETSERSNARLVRRHLLKDNAAAARFVPLFHNTDAAKIASIDVAVLGMGNDGHTASFFPGGDRLAEALDPKTALRLIEMNAPGASEPRITFTLPALLEARMLILHVEGEEKRRVLERAVEDGPVEEMPIRAILSAPNPVTIYWSPR
jgi:6-phosphogluconolactonase